MFIKRVEKFAGCDREKVGKAEGSSPCACKSMALVQTDVLLVGLQHACGRGRSAWLSGWLESLCQGDTWSQIARDLKKGGPGSRLSGWGLRWGKGLVEIKFPGHAPTFQSPSSLGRS